tara:strand:- start:345 stop:716 length:372 start_codon:yes stop_codon:yes gene_type:complete
MSFFNVVKQLLNYNEIMEKKQEQYRKDVMIETKLRECFKKCPEQSFDYLLNYNQMIREFTSDVMKNGNDPLHIETIKMVQDSWWKNGIMKSTKECCTDVIPSFNSSMPTNFIDYRLKAMEKDN